MMGMRIPETCWAVFERQAIKLRGWCIWLVDLFEFVWNAAKCWSVRRTFIIAATSDFAAGEFCFGHPFNGCIVSHGWKTWRAYRSSTVLLAINFVTVYELLSSHKRHRIVRLVCTFGHTTSACLLFEVCNEVDRTFPK